ncbi:MAG: bacillithiol biosynthesis cysteine-adding enzyme BshC [Acidobacteria bacterium]|nr:bacillithiol biosynthesis cysteine-adding enzyme BshC [Acidobacteriota bacterium]
MTSQPDTPPTGAVRMAVDIRRYPGIRRLAGDYAYDFARLREFFAGDPAEPDAWRMAIERARAHPRDRAAVADALVRQQQRRGAPPEARAAVERLRDPDTVAVVTGQQAGLFGGPLFTLLKAITALKLAARIRQDHHVPAVAVFWIDAEDHDWDEVSACEVLDGELHPHTIRLAPPDGAGSRPVGTLSLTDAVTGAIDDLAAALPATEFTATLLTRLRSAYRPGTGMGEAFGRWLEFVLGEFGMVVYDASDPATKPLVRALFTREAQFAGRTAELAAEVGGRLVAKGYHAQVTSHTDGVALFSLHEGRQPVRFADGLFHVGERTLSQAALLADIEARPAAFSPNVLLRPLVQDTVFPTVAYVAGPNELAYLGQLKPVYAHFGVPMPLMVPRSSATILDSAGVRFLSKNDLELESLHAQDESTLNRLLEAQLPQAVEQAFQDAASALDEKLRRLIEAVPAVDPTLEGAAKSVAGRMHHELQGLHTKMIHAAKKRDDTLRRQFTRTRAQAFPAGHAQERSIGFVSFLNRYGPGLVDRLLSDLPLDLGRHWVVTV